MYLEYLKNRTKKQAIGLPWPSFRSFLGGSDGKESSCNAADPCSIPRLERSRGEENGEYPLQYSCLRESHGQRSLVGYSPWVC